MIFGRGMVRGESGIGRGLLPALTVGLLLFSAAAAPVQGQASVPASAARVSPEPGPGVGKTGLRALDPGPGQAPGVKFGPLQPGLPPGITVDEIIARFATRESAFKKALEDYTYRRTVKFDTLDTGGHVDGEYLRVDDIVFTTSGQRRELAVFQPESTLTRALLSPADFDDLEHRMPFTLTTAEIGQYRFTAVGRQTVDAVPTVVFDVAPKRIEDGRRYFKGRIWVDAAAYQILLTTGRNVPDDTRPGEEDLSMPFTTYRQRVDGKYWFPVRTTAEAVLHFENCRGCLQDDLHVRETVRYGEYRRFGTSVRILYDGFDLSAAVNRPGTDAPAARRE